MAAHPGQGSVASCGMSLLRRVARRVLRRHRSVPAATPAANTEVLLQQLAAHLQQGPSASAPLRWPKGWDAPETGEPPLRPIHLFDPPQPIEVMAEIPDGPPMRFRWQRKLHDVARFEGP